MRQRLKCKASLPSNSQPPGESKSGGFRTRRRACSCRMESREGGEGGEAGRACPPVWLCLDREHRGLLSALAAM